MVRKFIPILALLLAGGGLSSCSRKTLQAYHTDEGDLTSSVDEQVQLPVLSFSLNGDSTPLQEYQLAEDETLRFAWNTQGVTHCVLMPFGQELLSGELDLVAAEVTEDILVILSCTDGVSTQEIRVLVKAPPSMPDPSPVVETNPDPEPVPPAGCELERNTVGNSTDTYSVRSKLNEILGINPITASAFVAVAMTEDTANKICELLDFGQVNGQVGVVPTTPNPNLFGWDSQQQRFENRPAAAFGGKALLQIHCLRVVCEP